MKPLTPIPFMLLCGMFLSCGKSPTKSEERPQVIVTEDITEDTVWESGTDYVICGNVAVVRGNSLVIMGGASVKFCTDNDARSCLYVYGEICAGDSVDDKEIIFSASGEADDFMGINIQDSAVNCFYNCRFTGGTRGIVVSQGGANIKNCKFFDTYIGISISKGAVVSLVDNLFKNNHTGVFVEQTPAKNDNEVIIFSNTFNGAKFMAVDIRSYSDALISENIFENCVTAIRGYYFCRLTILKNFISNCRFSIIYYEHADGLVYDNLIMSSEIGIDLFWKSAPKITCNNIEGCTRWSLRCNQWDTGIVVDATNNYWGTSDSSLVRNCIMDKHAVNGLDSYGEVVYVPYSNTRF